MAASIAAIYFASINNGIRILPHTQKHAARQFLLTMAYLDNTPIVS